MKNSGAERGHGLLQRDGPVLVLFLALTGLMTNPLVLHVADAVEDKQDGLLNTWIIAWAGHALISDPLHLFDANIFYPLPRTLAFSEALLTQGLLALPINLSSGNPVLGYNLILLFSFFLAAYGMYLFVFDLTKQRGAAVIAGTIFAFNPYNLGNLAQVQLLSFGWLPLALMSLRRIIKEEPRTGDGRPPPTGVWRLRLNGLKDPFVFALFFSLQTLSSFYYGLLAGVAVALYIFWSLVTHHVSPPKRLGARRSTFYVSLFVRLSISAIIIALLVVPVLLPYLQVQRELGLERSIEENEQFSASLKLFTEVSAQNVVYGRLLSPRPPIFAGGYPQDNLFPGLIPVGLAIAGMIASKSRERWFHLSLLVLAFVLALGPRLFITPSLGTSITLPYRWLYDVFPLAHALRAPVRFDALVMLAMAVLAGMGVQAVGSRQQQADSRQKAEGSRLKAENELLSLRLRSWQAFAPSAWLTAGFCLLIFMEYLAVPAANITPVPVGEAIPAYVRWLAQQPQSTILELPMIGSECACSLDLTSQYLSTFHWQRTPDGYSGFNPKPRGGIAYEMQFLPSERSVSLLQALDVGYLVLHSEQMPDWETRRAALAGSSNLQFVQQFGSDYVYRVAPRRDGAALLQADLYLPNPTAPNQGYTAYLIMRNPGPRSVAIKPTEILQVEARWSDGTRQQLTAALPLVTSSVSVVPLQLASPPRIGEYRLDLRTQGNAIGSLALSGDVAVSDEEPAHQVVLPAGVILNSSLKSVYAPGDTVDIGVTWQALNKIDTYYSVSVRVVDTQGNKKSDAGDRQPAVPTMLWVPGSEIPDRFSLTLPRDLAPGQYSVQLLVYQPKLGVDALLLDKDYIPRETIELAKFSVK